MTRKQARELSTRLERVVNLHVNDIRDWLALCEDELRITLPDRPQLLARFAELKERAAKDPNPKDTEEVRSQVRSLFRAACVLLDSEPLTTEDLTEEIDRVVLKSRYVQALGILFLVLLSLITGVWTFKLEKQWEAAQNLLQDARRKQEETNAEVAKMSAESKNREAELSLFLLQSNAAAIQQMEKEAEQFKKDVGSRKDDWVKQIDEVGPTAKQQVIDAGKNGAGKVTDSIAPVIGDFNKSLDDAKKSFGDSLARAQGQLEAAKNPLVPVVLWGSAKWWLLVPVIAVLSVIAFLGTMFLWMRQNLVVKVLAWVNIALLIAAVVLVARLR